MKVGANNITITQADMRAFQAAVARAELSENEIKERIALAAVDRGIDLTIGGLDEVFSSRSWYRECED